jgi:hypothetical protein
MNTNPSIAICTYRVKPGMEDEFEQLLRQHWPTLRDLELVTDTPPPAYKGTDETGGTFFVEILTWKNPETPNRAHELPGVMAVWEPMGMCCEGRGGRPPMEFPLVAALGR